MPRGGKADADRHGVGNDPQGNEPGHFGEQAGILEHEAMDITAGRQGVNRQCYPEENCFPVSHY